MKEMSAIFSAVQKEAWNSQTKERKKSKLKYKYVTTFQPLLWNYFFMQCEVHHFKTKWFNILFWGEFLLIGEQTFRILILNV